MSAIGIVNSRKAIDNNYLNKFESSLKHNENHITEKYHDKYNIFISFKLLNDENINARFGNLFIYFDGDITNKKEI